jgi:hypothetical protein
MTTQAAHLAADDTVLPEDAPCEDATHGVYARSEHGDDTEPARPHRRSRTTPVALAPAAASPRLTHNGIEFGAEHHYNDGDRVITRCGHNGTVVASFEGFRQHLIAHDNRQTFLQDRCDLAWAVPFLELQHRVLKANQPDMA